MEKCKENLLNSNNGSKSPFTVFSSSQQLTKILSSQVNADRCFKSPLKNEQNLANKSVETTSKRSNNIAESADSSSKYPHENGTVKPENQSSCNFSLPPKCDKIKSDSNGLGKTQHKTGTNGVHGRGKTFSTISNDGKSSSSEVRPIDGEQDVRSVAGQGKYHLLDPGSGYFIQYIEY